MDSRDRFYGFSLLFIIFPEKKTYYAGIMLDSPSIVLCSKLCRHNVSDPTWLASLEASQSTPQRSLSQQLFSCRMHTGSTGHCSYLGLDISLSETCQTWKFGTWH